MPAAVPLEDLERAHEELQGLEMKYPEAYDDFAEFFQRNRSLGYKNLSKLLMGEQTPRELKGLDEEDEGGAGAGEGEAGAGAGEEDVQNGGDGADE